MRTQLPKPQRRLDPAQHRDHVDVFYTTSERRRQTEVNRETTVKNIRGKKTTEEQRREVSRGLGIVVGPDSLELVQVVRPEHGPVPSQVLKVVHDDGDEQVDDLTERQRRTTLTHKHRFKLFKIICSSF